MTELMKHRLKNGERLMVFSVGRMFHHNVVQFLGMQGGWDGFWVDGEHSEVSAHDIEIAAMAGRAYGLDSFVRIPPTDYALVTRCFESGAGGVMGAQIQSAAHAQEFVSWCKFAPHGKRGLNPLGYDGGFGSLPMAEFTAKANRDTFVAIQIETALAAEEAEEIAAIDGVDLLFVGPSDLSQALGVIGDFTHERCIEAVDRIAAACAAHGKHWGAVTPTVAYAEMVAEKGCSMISPTNDVKIVAAGLKAVREQFGMFW